jgi:outer membrane protein
MKRISLLCCAATLLLAPLCAQTTHTFSQPSQRFGIVSTKKCLEESNIGKQETANFRKMETQMKEVLEEKVRVYREVDSKLNDEDYLDSISAEAERELKNKRSSIRKEATALEGEFVQTLEQANLKIAQKVTEMISKASAEVAQDSEKTNEPLSMILTDQACTYFNPQLDVTDRVIVKMNQMFENEQKDSTKR